MNTFHYTNLPEPDDLFAVSGIMSIDCVSLPVSQIDLLHPTKHHLQRRKKGWEFEMTNLSNATVLYFQRFKYPTLTLLSHTIKCHHLQIMLRKILVIAIPPIP